MNFLLLSYNYAPEMTGIGKYNAEMAEYVSSKGHNVKVVTGYPYYPQWKVELGLKKYWYSNEIINDVSVVRCPLFVPQTPTGLTRILQDLSFFISSLLAVTLLLFKREKYDVVFAVAPSFLNGFVGLWYKLFYPNSKLIYHLQDLQIDAAKELSLIKNKILLNLLDHSENIILTHADIVSTITDGMKRKILLKSLFLKNTFLLPNWTEVDRRKSFSEQHAILVKFGIEQHKKVIFYSGAIGEKQSLEILFDVAELSKLNLPNVHFLIAGVGPYCEKLKELAINRNLSNVQFIPLQPHDVFIQILKAATLHLVIQRRSASDLVMPSKLATILGIGGLALVTADAGSSLFELITTNNIALIVEPENFKDLYEMIEKVTKLNQMDSDNFSHINHYGNFNYANIEKIKENAANYAEKHLSREVVIDGFLKNIS